jgi:hypothetical protein
MKSKLKWNWNFFQMFDKSCERVVKMQTVWGGFVGVIMVSGWATEMASDKTLLIVSMIAYVINKAIGGFYFEDETYKGRI